MMAAQTPLPRTFLERYNLYLDQLVLAPLFPARTAKPLRLRPGQTLKRTARN